MTPAIHEVNGNENYGFAFYVCFNAESLGVDADGSGLTPGDIVSVAARDAGRVIQDAGFDYDLDGNFQAWNGGRHSQFSDVRDGGVSGRIYVRERDDDGGWDEWRAALRGEQPETVREQCQRIASEASTAMQARIDELVAGDK